MPFQIVRNDITNMRVDAIVNTANPLPVIGSGVDSRIHRKAGPELLEARKKIGMLSVGDAAVTPGFNLPAKYVIHTSGPIWKGGNFGEEKKLRQCYDSALQLAQRYNCETIAFPLISAGNYGFPKAKAMEIAMAAFNSFLLKSDIELYLVVFDKEALSLSEKLVQSVASYIDDNYAAEYKNCEFEETCVGRGIRRLEIQEPSVLPNRIDRSLADLVKEVDDSFSEYLIKLITRKGLTDPQLYKKANISRKLFNKIINNPSYQPSKKTAIALAMGLELNLDETRDFIGRAGHALSHSSVSDIIVEYFITHENYNMMELDAVLFEFDQPTISSQI